MRRVLIVLLPVAALALLAVPLMFQPTVDQAPADLVAYGRFLAGRGPKDLDVDALQSRVVQTTNSVGNTFLAQRDADGVCWALRINPPDDSPIKAADELCQNRNIP